MFWFFMALVTTGVLCGSLGYVYGKYILATQIRGVIKDAYVKSKWWTTETLRKVESIIDEAA